MKVTQRDLWSIFAFGCATGSIATLAVQVAVRALGLIG